MTFDICYLLLGASEWGLNFPDANGDSQSPININSREAEYDETLAESPLVINYVLCRETDMCNNGHSVVMYLRYKPGECNNDHSVVICISDISQVSVTMATV